MSRRMTRLNELETGKGDVITATWGRLVEAPSEAEAEVWARACAQSSAVSYFLSPGWVETWRATLPKHVDARLVSMTFGENLLAAAYLIHTRIRRHRLLRSNAVFLNQTGLPDLDQVCIEHNGVVCRDGYVITGDDLVHAIDGPWDELFLSGIAADSALLKVSAPLRCHIVYRKPSPRVDLDRVRNSADYLDILSPSTRSQINRSCRLYSAKYGTLNSTQPATQEQAGRFFEELVAMHTQRWSAKGHDGAFTNPFMLRFHARLINERFQTGEIQLIRICAGTTTIGVIYNFVYHGVVYFYQSGFRYEDDNRLKPGLVSHTEAVRLNAGIGNSVYDFLGGASRYKQSLATSAGELVWAVIQKPRFKFRVEKWLRSVKRQMCAIQRR